MEASTLRCSILTPFPSNCKRDCRNLRFGQEKMQSRGKILAAKRDFSERDYEGRLVDVSMIYLRKRIHEMKMIERNYEPPREWMEWEKQYYTRYDEYVCKAIGLLQSYLMNARPSLALGTLAFVLMAVPASTFVIARDLLEVVNRVFSTVHLT